METAGSRYENNVAVCLSQEKAAILESLTVTRDNSLDIEARTVTQSANDLWHCLRKKRITASKFSVVAKRLSGFENLVSQLNPSRRLVTAAMRRGIRLEARAAMVYASAAKGNQVNLLPSGLIIDPKSSWLGCSPDRKVYDIAAALKGNNPFGLLEIKVVKEGETDLKNVRYLIVDQLPMN